MRGAQWAGLGLLIGAVAVAGLGVVDGFAHSAEGREVRAELNGRRTAARPRRRERAGRDGLVVAIVVGVLAAELTLLRTGALRRRSTWATAGAMAVYSLAIDGWAAKPSSPIVRYAPDEYLARLPGIGLPVEVVAMRVLVGIGVALGATHVARRRARAALTRDAGPSDGGLRSGGRAGGPADDAQCRGHLPRRADLGRRVNTS